MLIYTLIILLMILGNKLSNQYNHKSTFIVFLLTIMLTYNSIPNLYFDVPNAGNESENQVILDYGVSIYNGLFYVNYVSLIMEIFILTIGGIILIISANNSPVLSTVSNASNTSNTHDQSTFSHSVNSANSEGKNYSLIKEYSIIIVFTVIGSIFLISSNNLVSLYLSIELQSFAVYILSTLFKLHFKSTAAGLKYFLLGALSSSFILLGSSIVYSYTGFTEFQDIFNYLSIITSPIAEKHEYFTDYYTYNSYIYLGFIIIFIGLLFKIGSAPFHNWAPDVYDGVPTIITMWLSIMPKISIIILLLNVYYLIFASQADGNNVEIQTFLLLCSVLSLLIGTIVGLAQTRIKRLLAYSTISHVGFILLALSMNEVQSIDSLLFYLIQYTITSLNIFAIIIVFAKFINYKDINYIAQFKGVFSLYPILSISFMICLFSMAGIPPFIGFFGKYYILYSSILNGYVLISIIAILTSVISAYYYLRIIRVIFSDTTDPHVTNNKLKLDIVNVGSIESYTISTLTLIIITFILQPTIILNITKIMAMNIFYS